MIKLLVHFIMRIPLIIAVFCLADVRPSNASEDQIEERRDELSLLIRRFNTLDEALKEKDNEIMELQEKMGEFQEKIEELGAENKEQQEKIEVRNPPFGYFCAFKDTFSTAFSVITYDKLLYSSQFGLQGESPGIDITSGKFVSGISGTWRVDFSLYTTPYPGKDIYMNLYKNGEQIPETEFWSSRSSTGSGYDSNTGGRTVLLHLDLGDELYIGTTYFGNPARYIIFCVSLEQSDA